MIRLIKWLFFGDAHLHKWKIIDSEKMVRVDDNTMIGIKHTLQCEGCGDLKVFRTY